MIMWGDGMIGMRGKGPQARSAANKYVLWARGMAIDFLKLELRALYESKDQILDKKSKLHFFLEAWKIKRWLG